MASVHFRGGESSEDLKLLAKILQFFTFLPDSWDVGVATVLQKRQEHLSQQTGALGLWSSGALEPPSFGAPELWSPGCSYRVKTEIHRQLSHTLGTGVFKKPSGWCLCPS